MALEYKRVPFDLREIKAADDGGWEIAGYASTFGYPPDSYGDVIAPGAFTATIAERATKFLYEHQTPIGKQLELREDAHGLWGRWSIVDTTAGTDAYKLAKAGVLDSLSIGYQTVDAELLDGGERLLKVVDLYEVSAVAIPANPNAVITDVKAAPCPACAAAHPSHGASETKTAEPVTPPAPPISFDMDDVQRCLAALGAFEETTV